MHLDSGPGAAARGSCRARQGIRDAVAIAVQRPCGPGGGEQIPYGHPAYPGRGQIADRAGPTAHDQGVGGGRVRVVDPREVERRALRRIGVACLRVPHDAQPVVEQHDGGRPHLARVQQLRGAHRWPDRRPRRRRRPHRCAGARPDGECASQQPGVVGAVPAGGPGGEVGTGRALPESRRHTSQRRGFQGLFGRRVTGVQGCGRLVPAPTVAGQTQQRPAHQQCGDRRQRGLRVLAAAQQIRRSGLKGTGVELRGGQQRVRRRHRVGLHQRRLRVRHAGGGEHPPYLAIRETLQAAQDVRRARRSGQRRQCLVQGEFVRAAGMREQSQAPDQRQQRRQLGPSRPRGRLQGEARLQGGTQYPLPDERIARVDPGRTDGWHGERDAVPGGERRPASQRQGPLGE